MKSYVEGSNSSMQNTWLYLEIKGRFWKRRVTSNEAAKLRPYWNITSKLVWRERKRGCCLYTVMAMRRDRKSVAICEPRRQPLKSNHPHYLIFENTLHNSEKKCLSVVCLVKWGILLWKCLKMKMMSFFFFPSPSTHWSSFTRANNKYRQISKIVILVYAVFFI